MSRFLGDARAVVARYDTPMIDDLTEEAATALRATGRRVEPTGDDLALWLVDGEVLTDGQVVALAFRLGLMTQGTERVQ